MVTLRNELRDEWEAISPHVGGVSFRPPLMGSPRRQVNSPEREQLVVAEASDPLPEPSSDGMDSPGDDEDEDDSLYNFSPARVRPTVWSSRTTNLCNPPKFRKDAQAFFASSPSYKARSHKTSSPTRSPTSYPSPRDALNPARTSVASTAVWRRSTSSNGSVNHEDEVFDANADEHWKLRSPRRIGKGKEKSYEMVLMPTSPESVDTVEISPPTSSVGGGDST
jgi:hypothetical protein